MIDPNHKMSSLVAHLMHYYAVYEKCPLRFPEDFPDETPTQLGFTEYWKPLAGMQEDWQQDAHILGEKPCVIHMCKDDVGKWFAYLTHGWKNGPFRPSPDHPAIADNVSIVKRLAGLISAPMGFLIWDMHDKRTGDFNGEVILSQKGSSGGEEGRLLRSYVTDSSFRIVWYADEVESILYQGLDSGAIRPDPKYSSKGRNKLKDHMNISLEVPETEIELRDTWRGLDAYDFCE